MLWALRLTDLQFIKILYRDGVGLAHGKRLRSSGTAKHSLHLGRQLWEKDWQSYDRPRIPVDIRAKIQLYVFTSARVGDYIESTCCAGSGRSLYYRAFESKMGKPNRYSGCARHQEYNPDTNHDYWAWPHGAKRLRTYAWAPSHVCNPTSDQPNTLPPLHA